MEGLSELSSHTDKITPLDFTPVILGLVLRDTVWLVSASDQSESILLIAATPEAVARVVSSFLFGWMSDVHGSALKKHISSLVKVRIATALYGAPDVVMEWQVRRNNFTRMSFVEHDNPSQEKGASSCQSMHQGIPFADQRGHVSTAWLQPLKCNPKTSSLATVLVPQCQAR